MDISSVQNARITTVAKLARSRARRQAGLHLVEGPNPVREALAAGVVEEVFVAESFLDTANTLNLGVGSLVTTVTDEVLAKIAEAATPQGIVAVARTTTAPLGQVAGKFIVVLDQVADPGNAGTILRTADAAGADGVVFTAGSVDPFGPKSVRSGAGSTYHLPVVTDVSLDEVHAACAAHGQRLYGLDGGADTMIEAFEKPQLPPVALVLGNEAQGLSAQARATVDGAAAIPLYGRAESLNVAAAAAVAIYAVARGVHSQSG